MKTITVDLGERSYPIYIDSDLLKQDFWLQHLSDCVVIVSNTTVAPLYLAQVKSLLQAHDCSFIEVILPDGESYKTLTTLNTILSAMLEQNIDRKSCILALGGGVVGDMAGFAAAIYQRGINFVQLPTTLLAQVDSSVGGKTAVNHELGKNMIGAFYQPQAVIIDINTLKTLPEREFSAGMAEAIKYAFIWDAEFFTWFETNINNIKQQEPDTLKYLIQKCCAIKAEIVAQDETEQGLRAILNFGHTFGHAIETTLGHGAVLHGEAVAIGMCEAIRYGIKHGGLATDILDRALNLLGKFNLPTELPKDLDQELYQKNMLRDKKVEAGKLKLIMLKELGQAEVVVC